MTFGDVAPEDPWDAGDSLAAKVRNLIRRLRVALADLEAIRDELDDQVEPGG